MTNRILPVSFLAVCGLIIPHLYCRGQESSKDSIAIAKFAERLRNDVIRDAVHGSISAAIVKNGKVIWAEAVGYAVRDKDISADTGTIYRIGSITKTFTATILMQLVKEGKVKLDDPVEKYVPEIRSVKGYSTNTIITVRQLASHTSGLNREPDLPGAYFGPVDQWESKLLTCIPYTSLKSRPGTEYHYSNIGFALLGLTLERASGIPYIQLVQQRIFTPLHLENTFFSVPLGKMAELAVGFINKRDDQGGVDSTLGGYIIPCGGIYSTAGDLAKFTTVLMGKTALLDSESLREMKIPVLGRRQYYGLGLMLGAYGKLGFIGHGGLIRGYTAQFSIEQNNVYSVVILRNYNSGKTKLVVDSRKLLSKLSKLDKS